MYRRSAEYGPEYYPTLVWIMTILHVFFQSKRNLNTVETTICWTKNMSQNDLSKPFSHVNWNHLSSHSFTASQRAELQSISLTSHPTVLLVRNGWGRRFHPRWTLGFPPTSTSTSSFPKKNDGNTVFFVEDLWKALICWKSVCIDYGTWLEGILLLKFDEEGLCQDFTCNFPPRTPIISTRKSIV